VRILVTGFGPFLEHRENPSAALARALDGWRVRGVSFRAHAPLPVVYGGAARRALAEASAAGADGVLALGLAGGSQRVRLEAWARNARGSEKPDARGRVGGGRPVVPGAPARLPATLRLAPVSRAMRAAGHAPRRSHDAGGYVCNDLYYRLLHARLRALFVHVPADVDVSRIARPLAEGVAASLRQTGPW
jgi:pyroglutamyl-peptidase